jgi:hypothetical protein
MQNDHLCAACACSCLCPCCTSMSMLHVHVHAACPSSMLIHIHVNVACLCPCHKSIPGPCPCPLSMLHIHGHRHGHRHGHGHGTRTWTQTWKQTWKQTQKQTWTLTCDLVASSNKIQEVKNLVTQYLQLHELLERRFRLGFLGQIHQTLPFRFISFCFFFAKHNISRMGHLFCKVTKFILLLVHEILLETLASLHTLPRL